MKDFKKLKCDRCNKEVGYYELSGANWGFYCIDCSEKVGIKK